MALKEEREKKLKALNREAIRNAVISVMGEKGLEGLTMARVANEADMAKGTVYLYYKNKNDLIEDTIDWCFKPLIEGAERIFAMDLEPVEKIIRLITFHQSFFQEHQRLFRMLLVDQQCARSNQEREDNEHYENILLKLSNLIQKGIDKHVFKDINPMAAAIILMESSMQLTHQFLKTGNKFGVDSTNAVSVLKEIFLKGLIVQ